MRKRVAEQLRYGGVLEGGSRVPAPVRLPHAEFVRRFWRWGLSIGRRRKGCASLIEAFASDNRDAYQLGLTKVHRKNAHDSLETARSSARRSAAVRCRVSSKAPGTNEGRFEAARGTRGVKMGGRGAGYPTWRSGRRDWNALRVETALCEASEPLPFGDARRPRAAESITGRWCAPGDGQRDGARLRCGSRAPIG